MPLEHPSVKLKHPPASRPPRRAAASRFLRDPAGVVPCSIRTHTREVPPPVSANESAQSFLSSASSSSPAGIRRASLPEPEVQAAAGGVAHSTSFSDERPRLTSVFRLVARILIVRCARDDRTRGLERHQIARSKVRIVSPVVQPALPVLQPFL